MERAPAIRVQIKIAIAAQREAQIKIAIEVGQRAAALLGKGGVVLGPRGCGLRPRVFS